ncbi:major facilitator superfamily domain-containing protein [Blakeslea trispora]|nr:major facilitator superfamily domain-containing protein [Blakeslea trispora]
MVYCVLISCLGSFSNGWVIGSPNVPGEVTHNCPNGSKHVYSSAWPDCLPMDNGLWGFAVASFCVGGLIGGLTAGTLQTRIGRKKAIMLNNIGYIAGGFLIAVSVHESMFIVGRILCGLGCGMGSLSIPTYIGEVSTIKGRGAMGTCNQFFIVIGILLSSVIGLPLATVPLWRLNFAIVCIPAVAQFFLMNTCPETPRYLISVNRVDEAKQSLQKLRGDKCNIDREFYGMVEGHFGTATAKTMLNAPAPSKEEAVSFEENLNTATDKLDQKEALDIDHMEDGTPETMDIVQRDTMNFIQIFSDPLIRRIALTVVFLHAFQQLVGINAVMYYSTTIFNLAFDGNMSKYMAIITTVVNFVMTLVAVAMIDRMGRRPLLLIGHAGACLFSVLLVVGYVYNLPALLVVSVFFYVASFAIGIGPIPWLLTSEITPTYASSAVAAVATGVNWAVNFLIGQLFPIVFGRIQGYSFAIFAIVAALAFVFTYLLLPETKGRSLESIVRGFEKRNH